MTDCRLPRRYAPRNTLRARCDESICHRERSSLCPRPVRAVKRTGKQGMSDLSSSIRATLIHRKRSPFPLGKAEKRRLPRRFAPRNTLRARCDESFCAQPYAIFSVIARNEAI